MLNLAKEDEEEILKIFRLNNPSQNEKSSEYSSSSESSSNYQSATSNPSEPNIKLGYKDNCCKKVRVITKHAKEEQILIDLISKIEDPELKVKYIKQLKDLFVKKDNKHLSSEKQLISLNKTMERFSKKKKKEVTLQDLESEVNKLKQEIKDLKAQDKIFAETLSLLTMSNTSTLETKDFNPEKQPQENEQSDTDNSDSSTRTCSQRIPVTSTSIVDTSGLMKLPSLDGCS